jgi:pimeloyl-ACP methyl ester carboxylesterase
VIEPLILLPEMMCDARMWRAQTEALSLDRAVTVAPTHLGATVGEVAAQVLDHAPRRFALAGLGLGGVVALEVLRRAPERVTRLALIATDALPDTPQGAAAREEGLVTARGGRMSDAVAALPICAALAPGMTRPEVQRVVQDMAARLGVDVLLRQTRLMQRRPDQQRALRLVRVPVLILGGAADTAYPARRQQFLAELVPAAQLEILDEAGHMPTLEAPEVVTEALRRWLATPASQA